MQVQERLIVPGLGIVILLSAFILGVPLVYKLLLGLLGLATAGTYFAPRLVQVETRIAIAVLGLLILLISSSVAFWLTLLSFGAIAALQFQHRHDLQRNPATIAWLSTLLKTVQARRSGRAEGAGDTGEEAGAAAGDGEGGQAPALPAVSSLPGFVRVNPAGIGSSVLGVIAMASVFLPWILFELSGGGETESFHFTLWEMTDPLGEGWDTGQARPIFFGMLVLGIASAASIVLPRIVPVLIGIAGMAVAVYSYLYFFAEIINALRAAGGLPPGVDVVVLPNSGSLLAVLCYLSIFVLQLVPAWNRSRGKG